MSDMTIQLGQTVYGGTLNVTTGAMTVKTAAVDMGSLTWGYSSAGNCYFYTVISDMQDASPDSITSCYSKNTETGAAASVLNNGDFSTVIYRNYMYVRDDRYTDETAFKTAVTGQTVCYKLAAPTTIQLTPEQLTMLKGYNRLSSDGGGDITLTYRANKADSVQAEVDVLENTKADNADVVDYIENGNTASRAYSANQFILWKGDLYKVTTSIASGATITAGTNVSKTSIGAVLTALLNA